MCLGTTLGLSQFHGHGHGSWLVCEVTLTFIISHIQMVVVTEEILDIIGRDPSVSKSNRLYFDIRRVFLY